jgi:hypothetical protein
VARASGAAPAPRAAAGRPAGAEGEGRPGARDAAWARLAAAETAREEGEGGGAGREPRAAVEEDGARSGGGAARCFGAERVALAVPVAPRGAARPPLADGRLGAWPRAGEGGAAERPVGRADLAAAGVDLEPLRVSAPGRRVSFRPGPEVGRAVAAPRLVEEVARGAAAPPERPGVAWREVDGEGRAEERDAAGTARPEDPPRAGVPLGLEDGGRCADRALAAAVPRVTLLPVALAAARPFGDAGLAFFAAAAAVVFAIPALPAASLTAALRSRRDRAAQGSNHPASPRPPNSSPRG